MASRYDAIAAGDQYETSLIVDACLNRFRHRPLIILSAQQSSLLLPDSKAVIIELSSKSSATLEALAKVKATSMLALPGFPEELKTLLGSADKLTLISYSAGVEKNTAPNDLDDVTISEAEAFREFTGYPTGSIKID